MGIYNLSEMSTNRISISTPICIIGAGVAGLLLARGLATAGRKVTLIESGGDSYDPEIQQLNDIEDLNGRYKWGMMGRARGLGGTSSRWGGRIISLSQQEAGSRLSPDSPGWPFPIRELDAYLPEVERVLRLDHSAFDEDVIEHLDRARLFPRSDPDLTCRWIKWATFKRGNLSALLRKELLNARSLDIWLSATVCGFEYDKASGCLLGIQARNLEGRELSVHANEFIFAAGTIETTRLLLLLDELSGKRAFRRCRVLGRYFQDHLDAQVGWLRPKDRNATNLMFAPQLMNSVRRSPHLEFNRNGIGVGPATSGSFAHVAVKLSENRALSAAKRLYDSFSTMNPDLNWTDISEIAKSYRLVSRFIFWRLMKRQFLIPDDVDYKLHVCIEQAPHRENSLSLSQKRDRIGVPMVCLRWKPTELDEQTFRTSIARLDSYWRRSRFEHICPVEWTPAAKDASMQLIAEAQDWCHPSGTTRMGLDPAESVIGSDMTCHDVPNVRVVSASAFPVSGSVNPTLTIMQLALRCVDLILKRPVPEQFSHALSVSRTLGRVDG
jgi:choline dehydrogenase-like flavoprotein